MEFRLVYQGRLPSNGSVKEKHRIREYFHPQLKKLWTQAPLKYYPEWLEHPPRRNNVSVISKIGQFDFATLVCDDLALFAELDIVFLCPESKGGVILRGGDIDNRLKTLFDALRRPQPQDEKEIPKGETPSDDQRPFFCLLQDDRLIRKISVSVDRLLQPVPEDDIYLLLHVKLKGQFTTMGNPPLIL